MTEVRQTSSGGVGLFATRDFGVGDVILKEESPLIALVSSEEEMASLLSPPPSKKTGEKKQDTLSAWESIVPPPSIPTHHEETFRGMVQAAVSYAQQPIDDQRKAHFFPLYRPSPTPGSAEEREIIHVSNEALAYLQKNSKDALQILVTKYPDDMRSVMLIWSCNSFEGGKIYLEHSRINHSCNPNAVVQPLGEGQCVRAVRPIAAGSEITISYLGLFIYADRPTRQGQLRKHKHFECACQRCLASPDRAAAIPCPICHKRHGRYLDEDVQYDDEGTVHYAMPIDNNAVECAHCHETTTLGDKNRVLQLARTVSDKVVTLLEKQSKVDEEVEEEWEEQLLQLASSVLGARHWATNLLLLMRLDRTLQKMHSDMITTQNIPDLVEVAELIDSLQRLCQYTDGLDLNLHMGHLLGNAVIGVARTLVTLGDLKSKKYASEWLAKVNDYVVHFESDDMKKVVQTLQLAWQQEDSTPMEEDGRNDSNKRAKIS